MVSLSPIVLFVYNRPSHTKLTVESLQKNDLSQESELFIYSDAAKDDTTVENVNKVREYIKSIDGFKKITIIEREKNWGLANSIIDGVTNLVNKFGKIIVLEDDLVTSKNFLMFMNTTLNTFQSRSDIFSITGFNYPTKLLEIPKDYKDDVFLSARCMSWSWGTWKDRWDKIDWDVKDFEAFIRNRQETKSFNQGGKDLTPMLEKQMNGEIDSWAIRFCYAHYKNKAYCVYPLHSFVNNEGFDGSGVHCSVDTSLHNDILNNNDFVINKNVKVNLQIQKRFKNIQQKSIIKRILNKITRVING
ncbi:glycosyltransferase [Sulfurovum sp.]|uniref:glycosyltransferase n=1 Tax=Sulfurovum sp. TaxID=1969726 RepID=UPI00356A9985